MGGDHPPLLIQHTKMTHHLNKEPGRGACFGLQRQASQAEGVGCKQHKGQSNGVCVCGGGEQWCVCVYVNVGSAGKCGCCCCCCRCRGQLPLLSWIGCSCGLQLSHGSSHSCRALLHRRMDVLPCWLAWWLRPELTTCRHMQAGKQNGGQHKKPNVSSRSSNSRLLHTTPPRSMLPFPSSRSRQPPNNATSAASQPASHTQHTVQHATAKKPHATQQPTPSTAHATHSEHSCTVAGRANPR